MAWDATDWTIATNGDIRYTGDAHGGAAPTYVTVIDFYREIQALADDEAAVLASSDLVDITNATFAERSTDNIIKLINGYNIDDTAAEHIYDGSVTQGSGDTETIYSGLVVVGSVEANTELQIVQDEALLTSYWGTGLNADATQNILLRIMVKTREFGSDIDGKKLRVQAREWTDTYAEFSLTAGLGNSTAAIFTADDINNTTAVGTVQGWTITNTEGYQLLDIDGDSTGEPYYSQWDKGTQSNNDLYEYTKMIQRRGTTETIHGINGELFRGITHDVTYDGEGGTGPVENNLATWGTTFAYTSELSSGLTVGEYYDFATSNAKARLLALDDNGTSGNVVMGVMEGTPQNSEAFVRADGTANDGATVDSAPADTGAAGGRGWVLADDGTDNVYIQLIWGGAPADNIPMYNATSAGVYDPANIFVPNVTITARTVPSTLIGQSTGSNIIGAYGIGVKTTEAETGDKYTDLGGTVNSPPQNVTFSVGGLVAGDRVLVTNDQTSGIDFDQMTLDAALTEATETSVDVNSIPVDTPQTGIIRIQLASGIYRRVPFTSWTGSIFTIGSTDFSSDNANTNGNVFIGYIDKAAAAATESFTIVYNADRTMFVRVRDGGATPIKTFETTGSLGTGGGGVTAIRTSDA